jgi:hypothetical protein
MVEVLLASLLALLIQPSQIGPIPSGQDASLYIESCREAVHHSNRSLAALTVQSHTILCIYDGLDEGPEQFGSELSSLEMVQPDGLVAFSSGGPFIDWIDLIEALDPPFDFIIVDRLCASSCANYAFPLAHNKIVPEGSFVAWHGGPTDNVVFLRDWIFDVVTPVEVLSDRETLDAHLEYTLAAGKRTAALYSLTGAHIEILEASHDPDLPAGMSWWRSWPLVFQRRNTISIAYPPETLEHCFGIGGLEAMTHPGGNAETIRAAQRALPGWPIIVSMPRETDSAGCPIETRAESIERG